MFNIKNIFGKKQPKDIFDSKHIVKYAFTIGGKDYFQMDDTHNLPYERGFTCLLFYREISMNVDFDFLKQHCDAVNKLLDINANKGKIDIYKIKTLTDQLSQRTRMPKDPELVYKLASVVFFDKDENPATYEYPHNAEKIRHWKEHGGAGFFLQKPLVELIPFLKQYEENVETYLSLMGKANKKHSDTVSEVLSPK